MTQTQKKLLFFAITALFFLSSPVRAGILAALCALLLAALASRPIRLLEKQGIPRPLGTLLLYGVTLAALAALFWNLFSQLCCKVNLLSSFLGELDPYLERLEALSGQLPDGMRQLALRGVVLLDRKRDTLQQRLVQQTAHWSAAIAATLPGKLLFFLIVLLASAYAAMDWPQLCRHGRALLPEAWTASCRAGADILKRGLWLWLSTQGKLLALQFVLLAAALLALDIQHALPLALLIAFADALPLLGAGSVLVPWALFSWLGGQTVRALSLGALAALLWAVRTVLEPQLLGKETQLSPFYTVIALYLGLNCFGIWGMIVVPVLLTAGAQLLHLRKKS